MSWIAEAVSLSSFIPVKLLKICMFPWDPLLVIWEYTPRRISLSYPICMQPTMGCHKRALGVPWNTDHWSPFSLSFSDNGPGRASKPESVPKVPVNSEHIRHPVGTLYNKTANPLPLGHLYQQPHWMCNPLSCCMLYVPGTQKSMVYRPRSGLGP